VDAGIDEGVETPDAGVCVPGAEDLLDPVGFDANCDGVDGILAEQVYVAVDGLDSNSGLTPDAPVASLASALGIANTASRSIILVGAGAFAENVRPLDFRDLAHVIAGGYGTGFVGPRTVSAVTSGSSLSVAPGFARTLSRVTLHLEATDTPHNAAVVVAPSAQLRIEDCAITTGTAYAGTAGADRTGLGTAPGQPSGSRTAESATGLVISGSAPSTVATANACGVGTRGGAGAASDLRGGDAVMGGSGGMPAGVFATANGTPGYDGTDGTQGAPGAPLVNISLTGDPALIAYSLATGGGGGAGGPATGGGGGGGGQSSLDTTPGSCSGYLTVTFFPSGAGGGPGGMGGCAGTPGSGGQGGGLAAGIIVGAGAQVDLVRSTVQPGPGGAGGPGGRGGAGELGGPGGLSLPACHVVSSTTRMLGGVGGVGGTGGDGGRGGHGGGGAGGPSVGVWLLPAAVLNQEASTITPGAGGVGGASPGGPTSGGNGPDGVSVDVYQQTTL
jgi:hypothetical protein